VLVEPLRDEDVTHGVLVLMWARADDRPLPPTPRLPPVFGVAAGVALSRAAELRLLRSQVTTDPLTGLLVGAAFRRPAAAVLTRATRSLRPVSLLVACIEPAGRAATVGSTDGDVALQAAATRWRAALRPLDLLGRHGGDGLVVLLPDVDAQQAQRVADRLVGVCPPQAAAVVGTATAAAGSSSLDGLVDAALQELSRRRRGVAP
jgi:diguanylate cyclase (GGDEF)-like protein